MEDPSVSSAENRVISAFIAQKVDFQLKSTALVVAGRDMFEMNALLGLRSREIKQDMLLLLMIVLISLDYLLICRLMETGLPF